MRKLPISRKAQKRYNFLDRLEIKQQNNPELNFSTLKPYSRKAVVPVAEAIDSLSRISSTNLTSIDEYNLNSFLMNNSEWVQGSKESFLSKKPIWNTFYVTKPNLFEVNSKDFFLAINPVINLEMGKQSGNSSNIFVNTRGVTRAEELPTKLVFPPH